MTSEGSWPLKLLSVGGKALGKRDLSKALVSKSSCALTAWCTWPFAWESIVVPLYTEAQAAGRKSDSVVL